MRDTSPWDVYLRNLDDDAEIARMIATPKPAEPVGLTQEAVDFFAEGDYARLGGTAIALAERNDVESLEKFMQGPALEVLRDNPHVSLTFCVAHMLVDGSGNEAFARRWIDTFCLGTHLEDRDEAGRYFTNLVQTTQARDLTPLKIQTLLGLAAFNGNPFLPIENDAGTPSWPPPVNSLLTKDTGITEQSHPEAVRPLRLIFSELLRRFSPDQLPDSFWFEKNRSYPGAESSHLRSCSMAQRLWKSDVENSDCSATRFLACVKEVYGTDHQAVRRQMQEGFEAALDECAIALNLADACDHQFEAIRAGWLEPVHLERFVKSDFLIGRAGPGGHGCEFEPTDWMEAILVCAIDEDALIDKLTILREAWVDITASYVSRDRNGDDHERALIDWMVTKKCAPVFLWLLAQGADPERAGWRTRTAEWGSKTLADPTDSAATRLDQLLAAEASSFQMLPEWDQASYRKMASGLQAWRARRAANAALAEFAEFAEPAQSRIAP